MLSAGTASSIGRASCTARMCVLFLRADSTANAPPLDPQTAAPLLLNLTAAAEQMAGRIHAPSAVPPVHLILSVMPVGAPYVPIRLQTTAQSLHTPVQCLAASFTRECPLPARPARGCRAGISGASMPPRWSSGRSLPRGLVSGPPLPRPGGGGLCPSAHLPRRLIVAVPAGCRLYSAPRGSAPADSPPDRCPAQRCRPSRAAGAPAVAGARVLTGFGSCGRAIPGTVWPRRSALQVAAALVEEQVTTQLYQTHGGFRCMHCTSLA